MRMIFFESRSIELRRRGENEEIQKLEKRVNLFIFLVHPPFVGVSCSERSYCGTDMSVVLFVV